MLGVLQQANAAADIAQEGAYSLLLLRGGEGSQRNAGLGAEERRGEFPRRRPPAKEQLLAVRAELADEPYPLAPPGEIEEVAIVAQGRGMAVVEEEGEHAANLLLGEGDQSAPPVEVGEGAEDLAAGVGLLGVLGVARGAGSAGGGRVAVGAVEAKEFDALVVGHFHVVAEDGVELEAGVDEVDVRFLTMAAGDGAHVGEEGFGGGWVEVAGGVGSRVDELGAVLVLLAGGEGIGVLGGGLVEQEILGVEYEFGLYVGVVDGTVGSEIVGRAGGPFLLAVAFVGEEESQRGLVGGVGGGVGYGMNREFDGARLDFESSRGRKG